MFYYMYYLCSDIELHSLFCESQGLWISYSSGHLTVSRSVVIRKRDPDGPGRTRTDPDGPGRPGRPGRTRTDPDGPGRTRTDPDGPRRTRTDSTDTPQTPEH
jgi:hypothetical protein